MKYSDILNESLAIGTDKELFLMLRDVINNYYKNVDKKKYKALEKEGYVEYFRNEIALTPSGIKQYGKLSKKYEPKKENIDEDFLFEALTPGNKKKYRELSKQLHPDHGGDVNLMKELNNAKESDETFEAFYDRIKGKGCKTTKEQARQAWQDFFKDEKDRDAWHEKVKAARRKKQMKMRNKRRR